MRPKLPSADRLVPYLRSIDASRVYSNFGPFALSLEDRLAEHYGLNQGTVATVANATLGLAIALAVQQPPPGSLCAMPAWTFVASAHAAVMAGLVPYFVDVDPETWALDASKLLDESRERLRRSALSCLSCHSVCRSISRHGRRFDRGPGLRS